jgi:hypothetical protein
MICIAAAENTDSRYRRQSHHIDFTLLFAFWRFSLCSSGIAMVMLMRFFATGVSWWICSFDLYDMDGVLLSSFSRFRRLRVRVMASSTILFA